MRASSLSPALRRRLLQRGPGDRALRGQAGLTLPELACAMFVILVGFGGALGSLSSANVLSAATTESTHAALAAQDLIERLRSEDFATLFARYNAHAADDPAGLPAPGPHFAVAGLDPQTADADGFVGRVWFPAEAAAPTVLREDLASDDFGPARDLDLDGAIDAADKSASYRSLPVRVRVQWRGPSGNRSVEMFTVLGG